MQLCGVLNNKIPITIKPLTIKLFDKETNQLCNTNPLSDLKFTANC